MIFAGNEGQMGLQGPPGVMGERGELYKLIIYSIYNGKACSRSNTSRRKPHYEHLSFVSIHAVIYISFEIYEYLCVVIS